MRVDVVWPNGKTTSVVGTFLKIDGDDAYVEADVGWVAGIAETLEVIERVGPDRKRGEDDG